MAYQLYITCDNSVPSLSPSWSPPSCPRCPQRRTPGISMRSSRHRRSPSLPRKNVSVRRIPQHGLAHFFWIGVFCHRLHRKQTGPLPVLLPLPFLSFCRRWRRDGWGWQRTEASFPTILVFGQRTGVKVIASQPVSPPRRAAVSRKTRSHFRKSLPSFLLLCIRVQTGRSRLFRDYKRGFAQWDRLKLVSPHRKRILHFQRYILQKAMFLLCIFIRQY